jgi:hypothetical protein
LRRQEEERSVRTIQQCGRQLAEWQPFSGAAANAEKDDVVVAEPSLSQNSILGGDVCAPRNLHRLLDGGREAIDLFGDLTCVPDPNAKALSSPAA